MIFTCDVAAGLQDSKTGQPIDPKPTVNTLVVPTRDVIITLERDRFSDPKQADKLVLRSAGDAWKSEPVQPGQGVGAHEDAATGRFVCRFADVPHGAYRVVVDVGDGPKEIIYDIVVRQAGVFAGDTRLGSAPPSGRLAPEIEVVEESLEREPDPRIPGDSIQPTDPTADRVLLPRGPGAKAP